MGATSDILAGLDIDQIASALGQNPQSVESAAQTAIGSLLGGLQNNLGTEQGAISLANALGNHASNDNAAPQTGGIDLSQLDLSDGAKIVNHILPAAEQRQLFGGAQGSLVQKLLPLLAPIVMAYFAKKLTASGGLGSVLGSILGSQAGGSSGAGGLGDVLGQVLGGGAGAGAAAQQPSGGLGDILGQVLGGGAAALQQSSGGLGDILGQVLGGGAAPQQQTYQQPSYNQPANSGLTIPDSADYASPQQDSAAALPGVGDLLKSILFGR